MDMIKSLLDEFNASDLYFEGNSRILKHHPDNPNLLLTKFKDTVFSFKHWNIEIKWLGAKRLKLYELISTFLNRETQWKIKTDLVYIDDINNIATIMKESVPNIETVVKSKIIGSPKYEYKNIFTEPTRFNNIRNLTEWFEHKPYVRFDWRNPLPEKDKVIPEELANYFINTEIAKETALSTFNLLRDKLNFSELELNDFCLFLNQNGDKIVGEISTDNTTWTYKGQDTRLQHIFNGKGKDTTLDKVDYLISLFQ